MPTIDLKGKEIEIYKQRRCDTNKQMKQERKKWKGRMKEQGGQKMKNRKICPKKWRFEKFNSLTGAMKLET